MSVTFTLPNTIQGLDSASESSLADYFDQVLVNGGAYYSICIRSTGRAEPINLNSGVPDTLLQTAGTFLMAFRMGIYEAAQRRPPVARRDPTWNFDPQGY
jgi:hypothetical protein